MYVFWGVCCCCFLVYVYLTSQPFEHTGVMKPNEVEGMCCLQISECNKLKNLFRVQVSKCRVCKVKYDPVPRQEEWGLAEFNCNCGKIFRYEFCCLMLITTAISTPD